MKTDNDLDRQIRDILRDALDREDGPDPTWGESPAARRVAQLERRGRVRWPLRILAVAALIAVAGGAALFAGGQVDVPDLSDDAVNGWIAFAVADDPDAANSDDDIWLVALDQEPRRVVGTASDTVDELCPAFSPDGRRLAYGRVENENPTLAIVDVDADGHIGEPIIIEVREGLSPPCPVWSSDGGQIAFGVNRTSPINPETSAAGSEVWIVTATGTTIASLPELLATDLEWSPDGSVLAIASGEDGRYPGGRLSDGKIYLYSQASGSMRSLDVTLGAIDLTWSPDGTRLAYATGESENELRVIDIETERQDVLASGYGVNHGIGPVWSPDGETVVYQRGCTGCGAEEHEVVLVSATDASEVVIHASVESTDGTSLSLFPYWVTWSPDGQYLLYVAWGSTDPTFNTTSMMVAVPLDPEMPTLLLTDLAGLGGRYSADAATFVPIQTWGREPAD